VKLTFAGYQKTFLDDDIILEDDDPTIRMFRPEPELDEDEAPTVAMKREMVS
jgi:hypothetical protein